MDESRTPRRDERIASVWDLDGTLLSTDVFGESLTRLVLGRPWMIARVLVWLAAGRSSCKGHVAAATLDSWTRWPVRPEAETKIAEARRRGDPVVLATAAHESVAARVAADLGLFDAVLGSGGGVNLKGSRKLQAVTDWVRANDCIGFSYAGDSNADLPLWRAADRAIVVEPTAGLERRVRELGKPVEVIGKRRSISRSLVRALRPHQWVKNLLVFLPMILAHKFGGATIAAVIWAFVAFSACASTVYLLNDISDLSADREHPKKRHRPLASGRLPITWAIAAGVGLLLAAALISAVVFPPAFGLILLVYMASNLAYSTWLKRKPILDVLMLAGMYAVRVEAGAIAAGVPLSPWILAFSLFFFTSLAFAKRCAELRRHASGGGQRPAGRGYLVEDLPVLEGFGAASGYVSVLVLALYMNSPEMQRLYGESRFLWLICPLVLYWITRVWLLVHRGHLDEDPVVFAIRDRVSLLIALACFCLVIIAAMLRGGGGGMIPAPRKMTGWGGFPVGDSVVAGPADRVGVARALGEHHGAGLIARGLGRAYGDSAFVAGGSVVETGRIDCFRGFDPQTGLLDVDAGVSFADIIAVFLPRGWFLPTTPGTKFVTVGGAIAADVHGKNHHRHGSLGMFVERIDVMVADGTVISCSRGENADLFHATLGGMGLTGVILAACFRLVPVETSRVTVDYRRTADLEETLTVFEAGDAGSEHSVAWIDCMASGRAMGRSVVMQGRNTLLDELSPEARRDPFGLPRKKVKSVPFTPPVGLLNALSVRVFNEVFYAAHGNRRKVVDLDTFFYPLDSIRHWNRLYGPRGFIQYQAFFPRKTSLDGLRELLSAIVASGAASFLAVLKSCGPADGAMLSFLEPGHTLALDIPYRRGVIEALCGRLDRILLGHGGRLYLAKDALMDGATFRAMYPRLDEFLAVKRRYDPDGLFASSQSRRLGITPS